MFKSCIFWISCLLPLIAWSDEASLKQEELKEIEAQIESLKEQLHQINLLEMKEEVKGQGYMIADWEAYRRELELIRQQEKKDDQIELRIKKLEERKKKLLTE